MGWFRGKESNLYLLVQSQPSCQLDDPEVIFDFGFWILDSAFTRYLRQSKIQNPKSKIGGDGRTRTFNPLVRSETL